MVLSRPFIFVRTSVSEHLLYGAAGRVSAEVFLRVVPTRTPPAVDRSLANDTNAKRDLDVKPDGML